MNGPLEVELRIGSGEEIRFEMSELPSGPAFSGLSPGGVALQALWRRVRSTWANDGAQVVEVGQALADLLPASLGAELQALIGRSLDENRPLSIRISGDGAYELPWEWLHLRPETPFDPAEGPLALVPNLRIARESGTAPAFDEPDLRVLLVTADPGSPRFQRLPWLAAEARSITAVFEASRRRGIELRAIHDAMPTNLERTLADFRPHLVHFAGHGETRPGGGVLALNGPRANSERLLKAGDLAEWLANAGTQFVFLSACDTAGAAHSVADALIDGGVPSVVAMQTPVADAGQPHLARVFYGALLGGASTDEAMAEARQSSGSPTAWAAPVLYASGRPFAFFAAKLSLGRSPNNLPRFDTPFVGRDRETEEAIRRCQASRLVSIVGPGGMGKTRLAVEAAALLMDDFPDGVWRVECESCTTGDDVLFAIGRTLDLEGDERSVQERVDHHLAGTRMLLILDCLESVVAASGQAVVENLLQGSPVHILATSRFRLALAEESVIEVGGFDRDGRAGRDLLLQASGRDEAPITAEEEQSLRNICATLENVPLALIIAAGRLRFMTIAELDVLLQESAYSTLGGRSSGISAAIRRSLDLIPGDEMAFLRDLSVFSGSFSWNDVAEVYPEERFETLEGLSRLADRSLLQPEGNGDARRFRILDSVREYLAIHDAPGDARMETARQRHLDLFSTRAQKAAEIMSQGRWSDGTRILWEALPNVRTALDFAMRHERFDDVEKLCRSLTRTLLEAGVWQIYESFSTTGLKAAEISGRTRFASYLISLDGAARSYRGDYAGAEAMWLRRLALCREIDHPVGACDSCLDLAAQACQIGKLDEAARWLEEAAEEMKKFDRDDLRASMEMVRCLYYDIARDDERAIAAAAAAESYINDQSTTDQKMAYYMTLARHWKRIGAYHRIRETLTPILRDTLLGERRLQTAKMLLEMGAALESEGHVEAAGHCFAAIVLLYLELGSHLLPAAEQRQKAFLEAHPQSTWPSGFASRPASWQAHVRLVLDYLTVLEVEESKADS